MAVLRSVCKCVTDPWFLLLFFESFDLCVCVGCVVMDSGGELFVCFADFFFA